MARFPPLDSPGPPVPHFPPHSRHPASGHWQGAHPPQSAPQGNMDHTTSYPSFRSTQLNDSKLPLQDLICSAWFGACRTAHWQGAAEMAGTPSTMRSSGLGQRCDLNSPKTIHASTHEYTNKGTNLLKNPAEVFLASKSQIGFILATAPFTAVPALNLRCAGIVALSLLRALRS